MFEGLEHGGQRPAAGFRLRISSARVVAADRGPGRRWATPASRFPALKLDLHEILDDRYGLCSTIIASQVLTGTAGTAAMALDRTIEGLVWGATD